MSTDEIRKRIELQRFDPMPIAIWLCRQFGVSDLWQIDPLQGRMETWRLMSPEMTTLVEVGSIVNAEKPVPNMSFELRNADQVAPRHGDESQRVQCLLAPNSDTCKWFRSPVPPQGGGGGGYDMDRVCIYGVQSIHTWSNLPITVDVRLNWLHSGLQRMYGYDRIARAYAIAGGGTLGANMEVSATAREGHDVRVFHLNMSSAGYLNGEFVATNALVNDSNLKNGIIELPADVCDASHLPVYRGPPPCPSYLIPKSEDKEEADRLRVLTENKWKNDFEQQIKDGKMRPTRTFYAIPVNHVLAWPLRDPSYLSQYKMHVETLQFRPPADNSLGLSAEQPILLYFLLADGYMPDLIRYYRETIMCGVDMRPLHHAGFEFVPRTERTQYGNDIPEHVKRVQGVISVRAYLTYRVPPKLTPEEQAQLIPTLSPGFPSCSQWVSDKQRVDAALKAYEEKNT